MHLRLQVSALAPVLITVRCCAAVQAGPRGRLRRHRRPCLPDECLAAVQRCRRRSAVQTTLCEPGCWHRCDAAPGAGSVRTGEVCACECAIPDASVASEEAAKGSVNRLLRCFHRRWGVREAARGGDARRRRGFDEACGPVQQRADSSAHRSLTRSPSMRDTDCEANDDDRWSAVILQPCDHACTARMLTQNSNRRWSEQRPVSDFRVP